MRFRYCPDCGTALELRPIGDEGDTPWCSVCQRPLFDQFSTCTIALVINSQEGVPDRHYGEEVCLCAVRREGSALDEAEVRAILSRKLAAFKVPKYIVFLDRLPKNTTGKVQSGELANWCKDQVTKAEINC